MSIEPAVFDEQTARNAAADVAYKHTGMSGGPPNWFLAKRETTPPPPRKLPFTVTDACRALGIKDRPPSTWAELIEKAEWRDQAACKQSDPALFFPESGDYSTQIRELCAGCPVRPECLAHAINFGERFGTWGGLSEKQRIQVRRGLTIAPRSRSEHGYGGYQRGCRCAVCRGANASKERRYRGGPS